MRKHFLALVLGTVAVASSGAVTHPAVAQAMTTPPRMVMMHRAAKFVVGGTVTSVSGNTITITANNGHTVTIDATNAKFVRRFGGKSSISEISSGDKVAASGTFSDTAKTQMTATLVRDNSIQEKNGTFVGTVTTVNSDGSFSLQSLHRGVQTVVPSSTTVMKDRKGNTITGVNKGDHVTVTGMWDSKSNNITEVKRIKDNSIPAKVAPAPKAQ